MQTFSKFVNSLNEVYNTDTGPFMNAHSWTGRKNLENLHKFASSEDPNESEHTIYHGIITKPYRKDEKKVAILTSGKPSMDSYFPRGLNSPHSFYYDNGNGNKKTDENITIHGYSHKHKDGKITHHGDVDTGKKTRSTYVFK